MSDNLAQAVAGFNFWGSVTEVTPYGNGHINDTYLVVCKNKQDEPRRYILQRMNTDIFKQPVEVMENVAGVTSYLRRQIVQSGGDPDRETLNIVPTQTGGNFFIDAADGYWRAYLFVEDTICLEAVERPEDFYQSALAFGHFQKLLADYPAATLHETIPRFHDTINRFANLKAAVERDALGRAESAKDEIAFAMARESDAAMLLGLLGEGKLPLRVTHNDTKLNNVMLDKDTGRALCVIDLDTVMPGLAAYDFGDSIRFGASTAVEDEPDLSKVEMSLELFDIYVKGFLEGCDHSLTATELETLPWGAKLMTYECGTRFLADYLDGDTYFKTHRPGQNLDRARTQFKLVADMEQKWGPMAEIIKKYM